jgi:release factor glutamine methyltransferase
MRSLQMTKPRDWQSSRAEPVTAQTLGALLAEFISALSRAGFDDARRRARRAVAAVLDIAPVEMLAHPERVLDDQQVDRVRLALDRLLGREPLSRIVGRREFWGLEFMLSADTLDPRPETETIVEAVLRRFADRNAPFRLLDLGTGSGCILLALLAEFPNALGFGVDLSPGAVTAARRNASSLGFAGRSHFIVGDWGAAISGKFDAIVANPPYIPIDQLGQLPPEVGLYDPRLALDGGRDGLNSYRRLATDVGHLLNQKAIFVTEIGLGQAPAVAVILRASGLIIEGFERDLAGVCRCVVARAGGHD